MIHHCVKASWLWELGPNIPRDFKYSTHPEAFFTTATHFFIGVSKKNKTRCSCPPCSSPHPALSRQEVCLSSVLGAAAHLGDVPVRRSRGQIPVRALTSFSTQAPLDSDSSTFHCNPFVYTTHLDHTAVCYSITGEVWECIVIIDDRWVSCVFCRSHHSV